MIEESALVTRVDASGVWIEVNRRSACATCSSQAGCGQKKLVDWLPSKRVEIRIENPLKLVLSQGQTVVVGLEEGALLRASLLIYMGPLIGLIFFALLLNFLGFSESFQILGAMLGLMIGFITTRLVSVKQLALGDFTPQSGLLQPG